MLNRWLKEYESDEVLFPKLGKRRTWLMVKKDLERVGIPYETSEGIADFHAAGRHSHITELLRSGVSLPEAKELAWHADIKMTMRYAHIGMEDQAKAIQRLPWEGPKNPQPRSTRSGSAREGWECSGSESGGAACHNTSLGDNKESSSSNDATRVADTGCHQSSSPDGECQNWRRRESNEEARFRNDEYANDLQLELAEGTASWECCTFIDCQCMSQVDYSTQQAIARIASRWPNLLPQIRRAIMLLATLLQ